MLETMSGQAVPADCGENAAPQCNVLANEKQPFISLGCAAGIRMKANPECFVILLSSNPISISGHSINRIRVRLKVITGRQRQPPALSQALLLPAQRFGVARAAHRAAHVQHHHRDLGCASSPLLPLQSLCAVNGWSNCSCQSLSCLCRKLARNVPAEYIFHEKMLL